MSEKRFILSVNEDAPKTLDIIDIVADKTYNFVNDVVSMNQAKQLVELLNEQQATITELKKDLKTVIDSYDCERIGYCHKGEYCKKWSLNNDR